MSTRDLPASLSDLLHPLRARAADAAAAEGAVNPSYTDGYRQGWQEAVRLAEHRNTFTAPDWSTPLREYAGDLEEAARRVRQLSDVSLPPSGRAGYVDAVLHARALTNHALARAKAAEALRAEQAVAAAADANLSQWDGYPKALHPEMMVDGIRELALFLGGDATTFTGDLLRLIAKADPINLNKLVSVFPREVRAFIMWRAAAPLDARTLVALLKAAHAMGAKP